jgi:hypothetical protein
MTDVPLAADFSFRGPVADFEDAAGYRQMAPLDGVLTAAEILEIRDGMIVRGELIYDAEELRRAMRAGTG